jgi:hypothetical protein
MQKRWTLVTVLMAILVISGISACTKTTEVGLKPILELKQSPEYIYSDTTLFQDITYHFLVQGSRSEDQSLLSTFEISRTYNDGLDTTVYYEELKGDRQVSFAYDHRFNTLKKAGTERFTFTLKNIYGIVNQKIVVVTVR